MRLARRQAGMFGCPELPIVHIPARLADRTSDEIAALARGAVDAVIAALTSAGGGHPARAQ
jgi:hypothetical protein